MSYCTGEKLCKPYGCSARGYCLLGKYEFDEKAKVTLPEKLKPLPVPKLNTERAYWGSMHSRRVVSLIIMGHDAACRCCYVINDLTFDHVIPIGKGGPNNLLNGQILCEECNQLKGDKIISIKELRKRLKQYIQDNEKANRIFIKAGV